MNTFDTTVVAPVKGLITDIASVQLSPDAAIHLENWIPYPDKVVLRPGRISHKPASGTVGTSCGLWTYNGAAGSKLFVFSSTGIYDATTAGAFGAAMSAWSSGDTICVNFSNGAGSWFVAANGADVVKVFDGTAWANSAITGVAPTTQVLNFVEIYRQRLFFAENNKLGFWYLNVNAIGGAASYFELGGVARRGGKVVAIGTWTIDSGAGADDYIVFATSEGEYLVYSGADPGTLGEWDLKGVYYLARPLGRQSLVKYQGDLLAITEMGIFRLSQALQSTVMKKQGSISANVDNKISELAKLKGPNGPYWQAILHPSARMLIFNVPDSVSGLQYAMETQKQAWCTLKGWNARMFAVKDNLLFYVDTAGAVKQAWEGSSDEGVSITGTAITAPNYFGKIAQKKRIRLLRPRLLISGQAKISLGFFSDFVRQQVNWEQYLDTGSGLWDVSLWDSGIFQGEDYQVYEWRQAACPPGMTISTAVVVESKASRVEWFFTDYKVSLSTNM